MGHPCVSLVAAAACLILPASALAQQVGIKAGINFATISPSEDENPDTSRRPGPVGGAWVRLAPASRVSFQVEGLFSEKGVTVDTVVPELDGTVNSRLRLRYVEIPALARIDLGAAGSTARAFVIGGAAPAFRLSARAEATFGGQEQSRDISDAIHSTDVGLVGGFGVEFGRTLVEARYTHGLTHINTDDNGDWNRNQVFSVMAGFRFR